MVPIWLLALLVVGVNVAFWSTIGVLRLLHTRAVGRRGTISLGPDRLTAADVAILVPAHNEELVIESSLEAIKQLVPVENIHVISDASSDATVSLALQQGVHVAETSENVGKAGALADAISRFGLIDRFAVVLLLDADTRIQPGYFDAALPLFNDPEVVAVAGCAHSDWSAARVGRLGSLYIAHRSRLYALTQRLLKYGQTWRWTNATHIVPGFASLYRTDVLPHIHINPRGLVIEDFNMTFQIYENRLGRVGFSTDAVAVTQDPDNLGDYVRQVRRWTLGLWQTIRRHRFGWDRFSAMLALLIFELVTASVVLLLLPVVTMVLLAPVAFPEIVEWPLIEPVHATVARMLSLESIVLAVVVPDCVLTLGVALVEKRPRYLLYAPFLLFMRMIDAAIALYTLPRGWKEKSSGRWASPSRRAAAMSAV